MTELKCEACGVIGAAEYVYVRTLNGGLNLCAMCLANINGKNPELKPLREELAAAKRQIEELTAEREKLQAFKDWTHAYLDAHGVPHHPPGTHGAEGCRIGDRMDYLLAQVAALRAALQPFADINCPQWYLYKQCRRAVAVLEETSALAK